jgi:DNA-binding MarR family transcriptional regulator
VSSYEPDAILSSFGFLATPSSRTRAMAAARLPLIGPWSGALTSEEMNLLALARIEAANIRLSEFARRLQINKSNLKNVLDGKRKAGRRFVQDLMIYFNSGE